MKMINEAPGNVFSICYRAGFKLNHAIAAADVTQISNILFLQTSS